MVAHLLESKFKVLKNIGTQNNQIGISRALLNLDRTHRIVVLELGTNHFGEINRLSQIAQPNLGMILNIGPSHLEFLRDLKSVYKEKYDLIRNLRFPQIAVLNKDDYFLRKNLKGKTKIFTVSFGIKCKSDFSAKKLKVIKDRLNFELNQHSFSINTPGLFNVYNAIAAIACVRLFGLDYLNISRQLSKFKFPTGRLNIRKINGITFIDDTYNANPASLGTALEVLKDTKPAASKIIVLGDMLELGRQAGYFHSQAGRQISKICDIIITVGKLSRLAAQAAQRQGFPKAAIFSCASSRQAKEVLYNQVRPGRKDVVLLKGSRRMKIEKVIK